MKAVFFDLDGTLLDTLPDIHAVLLKTLSRFGYPAVTPERTKACVGEGARRLLERVLPEGENVEESFAYFVRTYAESENLLTRPYGGIEALLTALKERGIKLAVITNKPQDAAVKCIGRFFPETFDFVGGDSGSFPCKPDPSLLRYAALTMRVPLVESALLGDGEADVLTAKNAGVRGVSALWGYRSREALERAGAREFAASPAEAAKILLGTR